MKQYIGPGIQTASKSCMVHFVLWNLYLFFESNWKIVLEFLFRQPLIQKHLMIYQGGRIIHPDTKSTNTQE